MTPNRNTGSRLCARHKHFLLNAIFKYDITRILYRVLGGVSVFKYAYVALASAAMSLAMSASVEAQHTPLTAGGDVTAEEATPLPPVVVESPSQPITEKKSKGRVASSVGGVPAQNATAQAQQAGQATGVPGVGIYTLGQLDMIGGSTITNEAMWTFNKNSVDQAVGILPGVTMTNTGGSRNEKDILVRGFDRFRVPLYMDGVRIYLPYDNRLDFNRFLTPDLSEIQVEKGYVSVLNGPGGEGGAINLVSRKPTKEIELEGRSGSDHDGDLADLTSGTPTPMREPGRRATTRNLSGNIVDQDHFNLSDNFSPSPSNTLRHFSRTSPTRMAATAITPTSRIGVSTPRLASRRTRLTNTASTIPASTARRTRRSASIVRSCRDISWQQPPLLGLADLGRLDAVGAHKNAAGGSVVHQDQRLLQHVR